MKNKSITYLLLIFSLLVPIFAVAFLAYYLIGSINSDSTTILADEGKVILAKEESVQLDNFTKKYKDYQPNFQAADQVFVDPQDPIDFIKFLEKTAADNNVTADINLVTNAKNSAGDGLPVLVFGIFSKGSFANILRFSEKLETGPYLIRMQQLDIQKNTSQDPKDKSSLGDIAANMSIEVVTK